MTVIRRRSLQRIRIITSLVFVLAIILVVRLYEIQITKHELYLSKAENQYVRVRSDLFQRGNIFFTRRDGTKLSAATTQNGYTLSIDPTKLTNLDQVWSVINAVTDVDEDWFRSQAIKPDQRYVLIDTKISNEEADLIKKADLTGIYLDKNQWRYYPSQDIAARTIGLVGFKKNGHHLSGRYGLERYYDYVLKRDSEVMVIDFFAEIFSNLSRLVTDTPIDGHGDIVTTLEPGLSSKLLETLKQTHEKWSGSLTGGIIINPQTGSVYALDVIPTFDLNNRETTEIKDFRNPLVEDVYEMGSTIKALTMAAGLDSQAITPESTYYDAGELEFNTDTIHNFDSQGRGYVNMQAVLNQSLNTGVAFVAGQMGKAKFRDYFRRFKLGSETGIDLPNETHGLIDNLNSPRDIEYATAAFGQGIAMTPIATVRALSALANGGHLITPHLVKQITYEDGKERTITYPPGEQVISTLTSETISRMLVKVVDEALVHGKVALPRHTIAAKTGTAQIPNREAGGYYDDRFLHSFFGYFPAYEPRFLIFLYTVEPKGAEYASETLTDPFMELVKYIIHYYSVTPDR